MSLKDLLKHLEELYQPALFTDFCPNGLQIEGAGTVRRVGTAVSASLKTIQLAKEHKLQALIVHHGLFWNRDPYVILGAKKEKIQILIENGISLLAYHLPMDAQQQIGNNWKAAINLGWENLEPFYQLSGMFIGVKGKVPKQTREKFKQRLEAYYGHPAATAFGGGEEIASAALISGGAYKQIQDASAHGIDCFITGNYDEPAWPLAFEEKINFFALGHAATERVGPRALAEQLKKLQYESVFLPDDNPF